MESESVALAGTKATGSVLTHRSDNQSVSGDGNTPKPSSL